MSESSVPSWLADFQRGFGDVLRTPLDRSSGALRAAPSEYDARALAHVAGDAPARLGVYNRQYWFRLFGVMQREFPLVTALMGAWSLNGLTARFLLAHPPRTHDVAQVADGFDVFLEAHVPPGGVTPDGLAIVLPRAALMQAARVDEAFRRVLSAPSEVSLRPTAADAARLVRCRLVASRALSIVDEDWPLFEMRHRLPREPEARARSLPSPHPEGRRSWAVCRAHEPEGRSAAGGSPSPDSHVGHRVLPLSPLQARLLQHLQTYTVAGALARLEADGTGIDPAALARSVQGWLAESVGLGFWTALAEVEDAP